MSEFHSVIKEFKHLTQDYGFKCAKKLWYSNLVALSKSIDDIFFCYVIARVWKQDGSLQTDLWVSPINRPDDGLENLSANINIRIGYTQMLDETFFQNCEAKIIGLLNSSVIENLVESSKSELENPSFRNRKYEVYTQYLLPFFRMVLIESNNDKKQLGNRKIAENIIDKVLLKISNEMKEFFDKLGNQAVKDKVWELCYLYSL